MPGRPGSRGCAACGAAPPAAAACQRPQRAGRYRCCRCCWAPHSGQAPASRPQLQRPAARAARRPRRRWAPLSPLPLLPAAPAAALLGSPRPPRGCLPAAGGPAGSGRHRRTDPPGRCQHPLRLLAGCCTARPPLALAPAGQQLAHAGDLAVLSPVLGGHEQWRQRHRCAGPPAARSMQACRPAAAAARCAGARCAPAPPPASVAAACLPCRASAGRRLC